MPESESDSELDIDIMTSRCEVKKLNGSDNYHTAVRHAELFCSTQFRKMHNCQG